MIRTIALSLSVLAAAVSAQDVDEELVTPQWSAREPVVLDDAPSSTLSVESKLPPQTAGLSSNCADTLRDSVTGVCLQASTVPTLGSLYPLGSDFYVSSQGRVGIGTIQPSARLHVEGASGMHARLGTWDVGTSGSSYLKHKDAPQVALWHGQSGATWLNAAGTLRLQVDNSTKLSIDNVGLLRAAAYGGSGNRYIYVDNSGQMLWANTYSSRRFKHDIRDLDIDHRNILETRPVSFLYDNEQNYYGTERVLGYVAEEFIEAGLEQLVEYDDEGEPKAIRYEWIPIYMLEVVKEHDRELAQLSSELESTVARQADELADLRTELAQLREQDSEREARLARLEAFAATQADSSFASTRR